MDLAVTQCPSTNWPCPSSRSLRYSRRTHTFWLGILQIKWDIFLYIAHGIELIFLEKKNFKKKVLRRFPRWDYKVACYSPAKFLNINPLYTAALRHWPRPLNSILYSIYPWGSRRGARWASSVPIGESAWETRLRCHHRYGWQGSDHRYPSSL